MPEKDALTRLEIKRLGEAEARVSKAEVKLMAARYEWANLVDAIGVARYARAYRVPEEEVRAQIIAARRVFSVGEGY